MFGNHLVKFILPAVCSLSLSHALIIDNSILDPEDPLAKSITPFYGYKYKGIFSINDYGWHITQKWGVNLKKIELLGGWYDVKYFPHPHLPFAIFKMNHCNDDQRNMLPKLQYIADQEDLESNSYWATSMAFVPDPLSHEGKISQSREGYTQPLHVISKIKRQGEDKLFLSSGVSADSLYCDFWTQIKQKLIHEWLTNVNHIKGLLEDPAYQRKYLNQNISQFVQKKKEALTKEKEDLIKSLCDLLSRTSKRPMNEQENKDYFSQSPVIVKINQEIDLLQPPHLTLEKKGELEVELWKDHNKELIAELKNCLKWSSDLKAVSDDYTKIDLSLRRLFKTNMVNIFKSIHLGVADSKDQGGLIFVVSKNLRLNNNKWNCFQKVAGITCVGANDAKGTSIAINLTTSEVRDWISHVIDDYYYSQNPIDQDKRSADDEAGPSDRTKRPCIKQEPLNDDLALNPNQVQLKKEIKDEIKEEN